MRSLDIIVCALSQALLRVRLLRTRCAIVCLTFSTGDAQFHRIKVKAPAYVGLIHLNSSRSTDVNLKSILQVRCVMLVLCALDGRYALA